MIRALELGPEEHERIRARCREKGIEFLSTPFDVESLELLVSLDVSRIKVSSGDLTNVVLLRAIGSKGRPTLLSTGMATLGEIEAGLGALASGGLGGRLSLREAYRSDAGQAWIRGHVSLLHCTTEYPAPLAEVNLRAMDTLASAFGLPTGYSDHTKGITVSVAAVARGATILEKHFTLDRTMKGPDHAASLEPGELRAMVEAVREVELSLGSGVKRPSASEEKNIVAARRSLVATRRIAKGEPFTVENLGVKRPGTGVSPLQYDEYLSRRASRDFEVDELVD